MGRGLFSAKDAVDEWRFVGNLIQVKAAARCMGMMEPSHRKVA